jgi:membrane-associated phospholipid phosphatase
MMQRWQRLRCSSLGHILGLNIDCGPGMSPIETEVDPVVPNGGWRSWERRVALALNDHSNPTLEWWMRRSTDLAYGQISLPIALALVGRELQRGRRKSARVIAIVWVGGLGLHVSVKLVARRKRPMLFPALARAGGYSLPSGHTVTAVVTYGLAAWAVRRYVPEPVRWVPSVVATGIVAAVGTSRVYLGVHYPSDVLAGATLGFVWLQGSLTVLTRIEAEYVRRGAWLRRR